MASRTSRRAIALTTVLAVAMVAAPAHTYFAGGGRDVEKGNDCLIGYDGIDQGDVTVDGKRQLVECTDCDPACDFDGDPTANNACTFKIGVCLNQATDDPACARPNGLDKATAKYKAKGKGGVKGEIALEDPTKLTSSACGSFVELTDLLVELKEKKDGTFASNSATFNLSGLVSKDKEADTPKRKDKDKLTYACLPRPAGEACPSASTTTTSFVSTTVTTTTSSTDTTVGPTSTSSTTATSSSSTTSTSEPLITTTTTSTTTTTFFTTTTSTSIPTTTSTSTTSTTSTTTSTIIPELCGDGNSDAGETCDDGNDSDNDGCPANCFIAACTPLAGTVRAVTVSFGAAPNVDVAGLTLLLNYPEEKVFMPPAGPQAQISATYFVPAYPPASVFIRGADLAPAGSAGSGHAVRGVMANSEAVPHGPIFTLKFQDCEGAAAPIAGEFNCSVLDASDPFSNPLQGVACSAALP